VLGVRSQGGGGDSGGGGGGGGDTRCLPVGLQDVNNADEQQEALSLAPHGWDTAHPGHRKCG